MSIKILFLLPLITLSMINHATNSELVYISELFRHGARYTLHKFYDYEQTFANKGELTSVGMRQQYNLGRYLRRDYIDQLNFLNPNYDSNELQVLAAPGNRIYVSAYSQLYGLYPNGTGPLIPQGLDQSFLQPPYQSNTVLPKIDDNAGLPNRFQPIPVHDGYRYLDDCPASIKFEAQRLIQQAAWYGRLNAEYLPFMERMKKIFEISQVYEINILSMSLLYDVVVADRYLGRPLPAEFTQQDFNNLRHMAHFMLALVWSGQYSRLLSTPLFKKIIADFDDKLRNPSSSKKFTMFSGHDTNVAPTNWYLNISSAECIEDLWKNNTKQKYLNCEVGPDFAANVIIELYRDQIPFVKIRYNGKYVYLCEKKSYECSYSEWKSRIENGYVDYEKLCQVKNKKKQRGLFEMEIRNLRMNSQFFDK